jgi:hypothetical protein
MQMSGEIMKCKNCKVVFFSRTERCPLCGTEGELSHFDLQNDCYFYPEYALPKSSKLDIAKKILFFLTIAFSSIAIFVNIFSLDIQGSLWSLLLASCLFYTLISFKTIFSKKMHTGSKILIQLLLLSALAIIIDIFTGFRRWSTSFVVPSLSIVSSLVIVFVAAGRRSLYKEFSGYLLTSFLVSIIPALLCLIKLSTHVWVGYAAFLVSLLMLLGLYVFSEKDFKNEMKKRFHF